MTYVDRDTLRRVVRAIKFSDIATLRQCLQEGVPPDADERGTTLLMEAANLKKVEPARVLVEAGANVNARNRDAKTPLYFALSDFQMPGEPPQDARAVAELVRMLVEAGAELHPAAARQDVTYLPLAQAAKRGDAALVQYLLEKGADAKASDADGGTALIAAINKGHPEIVRMLIVAGAPVNVPNPKPGRSPLHQAVSMGSSDVGMARYGGKLDAATIDAMIARWIEVIDELLGAGVDRSARDDRGWSALEHAINGGTIEILRHVLDRNFDLEQAGEGGRRPLHFLANLRRMEEPELIPLGELLVARGADRSATDAAGKTAAAIAEERGLAQLAAVLR